MSENNEIELTELEQQPQDAPPAADEPGDDVNEGDDGGEDEVATRTARELEAVFDVPVNISAILGRTRMEVQELLKLQVGTVVELDRKVGEAIDIYVNNRLVARGEVVIVEERLGVTMTEIIKSD